MACEPTSKPKAVRASAPAGRGLTVGCPLCDWTTRLVPSTAPSIPLAEAGRWMAQLHALRHLDRELSPNDFEFRVEGAAS